MSSLQTPDNFNWPLAYEAEALLLLGQVYLKMKKNAEAREAFNAILREYPRSPLVVQAENFLAYMKERGV